MCRLRLLLLLPGTNAFLNLISAILQMLNENDRVARAFTDSPTIRVNVCIHLQRQPNGMEEWRQPGRACTFCTHAEKQRAKPMQEQVMMYSAAFLFIASLPEQRALLAVGCCLCHTPDPIVFHFNGGFSFLLSGFARLFVLFSLCRM